MANNKKGNAMNKIKQQLVKLWNDESGQGATEYILLLVVVVALVVLFKGQIMKAVNTQLESLSGQITSFTGSN